MIKLKLLIVFSMIAFVLVSSNPFMSSYLNIQNVEMKEKQYVTVAKNDSQLVLELEEYLIGVVAAEMPAHFELEALKAQAVASRTFVASRKYLVDDTTSTQVYQDNTKLKEKWKEKYENNFQKVKKAVDETKGQVITYHNDLISATFFSSSNGKTNHSQDYWSGSVKYLVSVDSHWDLQRKDNIRKKTFTYAQLEAIFSMIIDDIKVISLYDSGYVKEVLVNEQIMSGREIRETLELASSSFKIEKSKAGVTFVTSGSGHGVGMSQYGAQGMALEGYRYDEILKHYYTNVEILNK